MLTIAELQAGVIFGDNNTREYVYMPGSEIGVDNPVCVYENAGQRRDVDMEEALRLIRVRSLRQTRHPVLGESSC
ncbi:MAG: hypothetical protein IIZ87_01355 [Selenomonas sp.]|uniref:hypothetical protein n=1 Tax=Selenomonas sp. AE3005 TaxID=1485543 RepID=UPI000484BD4D|nr:hypothetical protein [Selenomonas sp. AE3005]MBQ1614986.1 hypothetical protein [Selenomonas sp.]MBQ1808166.1 hypothetical protein [Selenomonas sp.]MBQ1919279.1 hypothetical protein [Selenomonas sp.]MBQ2088393.1 hypothetical protein [Selenomonas sp.]MBQ5419954.1 hypothetical protein [Selenomonas sp.]